MACFIVPATEAIVTTVIEKKAKRAEAREAEHSNEPVVLNEKKAVPFSRKLKWLNNMLWGGAILLAFEHVWHGEVVPFFPFLTATRSAGETATMLHEMSTVGVTMGAVISAVWIGMVLVSNVIEKRPSDAAEMQKAK